ncbi:FAD-dependent monooxygenase [Flavobacterium sp.]|uniref:FAD-dependent monooxygenase n=1 Tax=Flavobacterium sp. TaxID=239 RepID=UPI00262142E4|nr:FAD-dependent monooxygenase [Flavobacterium sp.]
MVGAGPAGLAAALTLQKESVTCAVIDYRRENVFKPGESLAPGANFILDKLGLHKIAASGFHNAYVGNNVVWGGTTPHQRYFLNEPYGNGLHLNRVVFENQLLETAVERKITLFLTYQIKEITETPDKILLECFSPSGDFTTIEADFILDCSGRAGIVAKKTGVKRTALDNLVSYHFMIKQPETVLKGMTYIESVADGWWYMAPVNDGKMVVNFMSDSDLHQVKSELLQDWLRQKIRQTQHFSALIPENAFDTLVHSGIKTASTSLLDVPGGNRWMAAGDALCSYDPLTSFGITNALTGGYAAAKAITGLLNGDGTAATDYLSKQMALFNKSVVMLQNQYRQEQRWADLPFWKRRH